MVTLTGEELQEIKYQMQTGKLPPDALKQHYEAEARNVFGFDARKVRGKYVEQGIGSPMNQTRNSVEAYRKYGKGEADYEANLKILEKQLAESNERRKAAAEAAEQQE